MFMFVCVWGEGIAVPRTFSFYSLNNNQEGLWGGLSGFRHHLHLHKRLFPPKHAPVTTIMIIYSSDVLAILEIIV